MEVLLINHINDISCEDWNTITAPQGYPFIRHEFLHALEKNHCVDEHSGWLPQHCIVKNNDELIALMPMYRKMHPRGEYVFDFAWDHAYQQQGLSYYPKWLTAIPFTPCEGNRIFIKQGTSKATVIKLIVDFIVNHAEPSNISSWHCLYPTLQETNLLSEHEELIIRQGTQFRWKNNNYRDFQDYLDSFKSKRRKTLLRERRFVQEQNINLIQIPGNNINKEYLQVFFQFYQLTYLKRGNPPYMNFSFFKEITETMPEQLLLNLAIKDGVYVGAALNLVGNNTLYGRYWGCYKEYHSLHFETCYYQGLEYCINKGLQYFDSGAQGEHKIARGFEPITTYSAHWIYDPSFRAAIKEYIKREAHLITEYRKNVRALLPFKNNV